MSDLTANGQRVTSASISIPYYGAPVADVVLAADTPLAAPVTLRAGNLSLTMAPLRQRAFAGSTSARLVGGAGGWGRAIPASAYEDPAGVRLSTVLGDAARLVGETISIATDRVIGQWFARERGPAQRVLRQLVGELWWMSTAGVTQTGARASTTIRTPAVVTELAGGKGWLEVATEDVAAWQPGATFSGNTVPQPITVAATRIVSGNDGVLRLRVLTVDSLIAAELGAPTPADRTLAAFRALVRAEDPGRVAQGVWEYQVQRADAETFDGSPTEQNFPLPPLVGVPYRGALAGASCVPTEGTLAYVAFANADPSRPILVAFGPGLPESSTVDADDEVAIGGSATITNIGNGRDILNNGEELTRPVLYGDLVQVGTATGPILQSSASAPNAIARVKVPL